MTSLVVAPNQADILTVLRSFLLGVLPAGTPVVRGQVNRVPEPESNNFVVMTPGFQRRLATNLDSSTDVFYTASIAGTLMTVTDIEIGAILTNSQAFGTGVADNTVVLSQVSGLAGGTGVYNVSPSQNMGSSPVASGYQTITQSGEYMFQLDVHGPNSADNAMTIVTMFRDPYAATVFAAANPEVSPLYADDPKQVPFVNAENQWEDRWIIEAHLQANQTVSISQQFADSVIVELISVDATFPPA